MMGGAMLGDTAPPPPQKNKFKALEVFQSALFSIFFLKKM
jgi:hypothetical protein